jgi:hypothetical protein
MSTKISLLVKKPKKTTSPVAAEPEEPDLNMLKISTAAAASEVVTLSDEQTEDLIEKLETKKYELIRKGATDTDDMREVVRLLSEIKKTDVSVRIDNNVTHKSHIETEFKQTKKEMLITDFQKIIDLTAPKEEREPDVTTTIWKTQKEVGKSRNYKSAEEERIANFQKKMKHKKMPEQLEQAINNVITDNLTGVALREKNQDVFKYKKYDPFQHEQNGLSPF